MSSAGTGTGDGTGTGGTSWFGGYDADTQAHIASRGWDKLPADQALAQAVKSHREAEKLIGVPAEHVVRWPKDQNDKESWAKVREKLGVPADAKDYDFSGLKFKDGSEPEKDFVERVRELSTKYHLPKDEARGLAGDMLTMIETDEATETTAYEQKLQQERETLKTNWGANAASNLVVAQNAAQKLFASMKPDEMQEAMSSLEKSFGYANIMEMFRQIGTRIGEDKFVSRDGGPNSDALTTEEAQAKLDMLTHDAAWVQKYESGDVNTIAEFNNLTRLIAAGKSRK